MDHDGSYIFTPRGLLDDLTNFINTSEKRGNFVFETGVGQYNFNEENVSFNTTNGIPFWIDRDNSSFNGADSYGNNINMRYRIVFADINPSNREKSLLGEGRGTIVPFAITEYGNVIPLGQPLLRSDVLGAKVKLSYKFRDRQGYVSERSVTIPARNFDEARRMAWGNTVWANNPLSYMLGQDFPGTDTRDQNPHNCTIEAKENDDAIGTGTCQRVQVGFLADGTPDIKQRCCHICDYNCSVKILKQEIRL